MLQLITEPITKKQFEDSKGDLFDQSYIKWVIDIELGVMTIGGEKHFFGEQLLLENGSNQSDLWGGGFHSLSKVVDFESMINIRPYQSNMRRDIESSDIKERCLELFKKYFKDYL